MKKALLAILIAVTYAALVTNSCMLYRANWQLSYQGEINQQLQDFNGHLAGEVMQKAGDINKLRDENALLKQTIMSYTPKTIEAPVIVTVRDGEPNEFESVQALKRWLATDNTSHNKWVFDVYDCDNFARDLVKAAYRDNYLMGIYVLDYGNHTSHIMCSTIIGNGIWAIEPQTDQAWYVMQVDENLRKD